MPGLMIDREVLIEAPVEVVWRTKYLDRLATLLAKRRSG